MGRLNTLIGQANDALLALDKIRNNGKANSSSQNKENYDEQYKRLKRIQAKIKAFGTESRLHKVTLMGGSFTYFTGLDNELEVKDILLSKNLSYISIIEILPGQILH